MLSTTKAPGNANTHDRSQLASPSVGTGTSSDPDFDNGIGLASDLAQSCELSSLAPLVASTLSRSDPSVAVSGRFKSGPEQFSESFHEAAEIACRCGASQRDCSGNPIWATTETRRSFTRREHLATPRARPLASYHARHAAWPQPLEVLALAAGDRTRTNT